MKFVALVVLVASLPMDPLAEEAAVLVKGLKSESSFSFHPTSPSKAGNHLVEHIKPAAAIKESVPIAITKKTPERELIDQLDKESAIRFKKEVQALRMKEKAAAASKKTGTVEALPEKAPAPFSWKIPQGALIANDQREVIVKYQEIASIGGPLFELPDKSMSYSDLETLIGKQIKNVDELSKYYYQFREIMLQEGLENDELAALRNDAALKFEKEAGEHLARLDSRIKSNLVIALGKRDAKEYADDEIIKQFAEYMSLANAIKRNRMAYELDGLDDFDNAELYVDLLNGRSNGELADILNPKKEIN